MKPILPDYSQSGVLIVGDVMLDRYWYGPTGRISPEAPVPVVKVENNEERPGGAANVAMNIASLGGHAHVVGLTGKDEPAEVLKSTLGALKVKCDFVELEDYPTITKLRVMSRGQQLIRLDFEDKFENTNPELILSRMEQALPNVRSVILSDYAKGALEHVQSFIQKARAANVPVFIDPKGADLERYRGATLLTPNMAEFELVAGKVKSEEDLIEKGIALIEKYDFEALLVTRSENGMTLLRKGQAPFHLPTQAKEVYDVTGAGDTVISVLAASVAAGKPLDEACALANAAAGVVVGKLGTSTLSTIELAEAIHGSQDTDYGVISEAALVEAVKRARAKGEKVVMTNGCFDILHAGHVSYMNHAAELGDRLIVAVNTDESVKRLKGPGRPVNPTDRRMAVLAGLGAVDWVVPFSEDTPQRLISEVLPSILVKGGDYKPEEIAGGAEVIAAGGEVKVLNFEDGCSTTEIIKAIKGGRG
ncbi:MULTISPECIES: bifunctional D-glycero-beta-D-manno-heptose-7-phosphate kinase/D-glycero-beta-D-manno-heptose 1-phosphate adenylyltransferase HldE [Vibrio]|jgi:D-beta-D-heptose 7-phosphate kinase/D-beta-D-heptose 1-phosphate adenosyltransferase|uniref:bifunctional D-glycero-beta-D-manno-heptose-7-phosphate kinase/D-glycero-beta-D-manno-heptose 1-phosphate adenylyltransferase HldE n=1 Tax=Vibrio TaxID=662 RepID=UPI00030961BB|nr:MULTISPECIES: bifunctional D-glycero-beta-D-manno-heptose-7-phosphate kinase/D-glycero-beta-D-manno-heptose 1-phosphate adenylyltransferase HldE [Vibrio]NOH91844.1 bifunctional D-glycero-beta-D-manno-heptose-7-phosphate kinase/D-glycero-beta-D-manno-heptose 1-phosphate adenylyltransferase HldE [Vibrio sp. AIC-3]OED76413.1 bifunctional heptose 7-phosphate kinase/heptose 1-phosphate adenyltransferase [Vibrio crassostreae ZF-91]OEE90768.1 bifunctional heptose 7-phosphate kinase/heptose 1-phospha